MLGLIRRVLVVVWLTFKEQSNWTSLPVYLIYTFINPVFQVALYGYIYIAVAHLSGITSPEAAFYMVSGIALFNYIGSGLYGVIWTIHSEREHFRTLKYTYLAFPDLQLYLTSRGLYHYLVGLATSLAMLMVGMLLIGYPMLGSLDTLPSIALLLLIGMAWSSQIGVVVAGLSIYSSEYGPVISESFGGLLFLLGAVLYPVSALPPWIQPLAHIFPMVEWMELMRHYLNPSYIPGDIGGLWTWLLVKTLATIIATYLYFRLVERLVRKTGMLEASLHH